MAQRTRNASSSVRRGSWKLRLLTVTVAWLILTAILLGWDLYSTELTSRELERQNELTQDKLSCLLLSDQLLKGSDRLTAAITSFMATENLSYATEFLNEATVFHTRDKAITALKDKHLNEAELAPILRAKTLSDALLQEELHAIRLLYEAMGQPLPPALSAQPLTPHEQTLSPEEKRVEARSFLFGAHYTALKDEIRDNIGLFNTRQSQGIRDQFEIALQQNKQQMQQQLFVNIMALSWPLALLLLLYLLLVRPIANYSRFLNEQSDPSGDYAPLTLHGSYELRTLGLAFNNVLVQLQEAKERLVQQNQELTVLSTTDHLTKVLNRLAMENYLNNLLESWEPSIPLSVIMLDLDHFKDFNDSYGHPAGDEALHSVAEVLNDAVNAQLGLVARMGGEEFFLLLPGMPEDELEEFAQDILNRVRDLPIQINEKQSVHLSVSLGSYTTRDQLETPKLLYCYADEALYHAKQSGRDRHVTYQSIAPEGAE